MHRLRALVTAVLLALAVAACSQVVPEDVPIAGPAEVGAGDAAATDDTTTDEDVATGPAQDQSEQPMMSDQATAGENPPAEAEPPADEQEPAGAPKRSKVLDDGPVGANAAAYLRGDRPIVILEVDVQEGATISDAALEYVRAVLARESNANVELRRGPATTTRNDAWTAEQLRAAADATRDVAHNDEAAVLHLLVLRDGYEDDGVLGLAFGSASAVIFPDQWSDLTTALLAGDRIARAVATHEVGHLLGLVGLYEPPTSDHEDPDHPGHTTDSDDVMYYAVERSIISQLDGIPIDFGPASRADLAAIREG